MDTTVITLVERTAHAAALAAATGAMHHTVMDRTLTAVQAGVEALTDEDVEQALESRDLAERMALGNEQRAGCPSRDPVAGRGVARALVATAAATDGCPVRVRLAQAAAQAAQQAADGLHG